MLKISLLVILLLIISSSAHADYRPNHGGFAHAHDCEGSELDNCTPHHHFLDSIGVRIAVKDLLHKAIVELHNNFKYTKRWIPDNNYKDLKEALVKYFNDENQKELLDLVPKSLGNAPGYCQFSPPDGVNNLVHSVEECDAFKEGRTPHPSLERVARPNIEDFIEDYVEKNRSEKI